MCSYYLFSSLWVAKWPPLGKELLTRLTVCSLCILTICILVIFRFGFEGWIWVLIASVPGLCILFTLIRRTVHVHRFFLSVNYVHSYSDSQTALIVFQHLVANAFINGNQLKSH